MSEQQFLTPQPVGLEVKVAAGDIRITAIDGDQSTVVVGGPEKLVEATRVELVGDRLRVEQRRNPRFGWFSRWEDGIQIDARVPHSSTVEIVTASADTRLEGSFGPLDVKSASGDILAIGQIDGDASVSNVSGDVRLAHVTGDLTVRTVSGDVSADVVDGSVSAQSVSGDVRVGSLRDGRVTVKSVSGDVQLGIASGTSVDVDAGTASGELSSEVPLSDTPENGDGPAVVIRSNTVSGDLRVFRAA